MGCCGLDGTAGSELRSHGRATGLRSRSSGRGGEQGTGAAGPGHCTEMAHGRGSQLGTWARQLVSQSSGTQGMGAWS